MLLFQDVNKGHFVDVILLLQLGVPFFNDAFSVLDTDRAECLGEIALGHSLDAKNVV